MISISSWRCCLVGILLQISCFSSFMSPYLAPESHFFELKAVESPYKASKVIVSDHNYIDNAMLGNEIPLYIDEDIIAINKAFYARTVPSQKVRECAAINVMTALGIERVDHMIAHRLDYGTSGIVLFARNIDALRSLHEQFRNAGHVKKVYKAVVEGHLPTYEGVIDLPLGKDLEKGSPFCKVDIGELGKESLTEWRCVERKNGLSLVDLYPKTGRTHQLRLHMAAIGHPIVGDCFYAPLPVQEKSNRLLLHAEHIHIMHPRKLKPMHFYAPCPFNLDDL